LQLDLQFYAFFVVVLCGVLLGLFFDLLRTVRIHYRPRWLAGAGADLLFWAAVTGALAAGLFYGNWGEIRFYVLVALLLGLALYLWLASSVVTALTRFTIRVIEWLIGLVVRMLLAPILAVAAVLRGVAGALFRWAGRLGRGMLRLLVGTVLRPLVGPYRYLKLHYLLFKRRLRRRLGRRGRRPPRR
jgi:spore cortex biosynthesis protein YabQ